ncbi:MAG TPA: DEAD/DEAH box helicase [Candidatus Nanoarchaeia archaeon]|nr:DEAD/DEAH box helicase [Candidatus Nanoarchaeia archaeon]
MIKDFTPRLYQETIFSSATTKNTLVVLPTGMGKTNIFLMLTAHRLRLFPQSKVLFIGPTKPLIDQYLAVFKKHFDISEDKLAVFTGNVRPEKRAELWNQAQIFFSTPQGLENDIITNRIKLEEVCLLGVDEAHRAVGDYAYVFVAKEYKKRAHYPRILALTASPGSDMEKIQEVCNNLFIEDIEIRTDESPDVKPYIQEVRIDWVKVTLPPIFLDIQKCLNDFLRERIQKLKDWGMIRRKDFDLKFVTKKDLLALQGDLRSRAATGERDFVLWNGISILAEVMKMQHALELIETQGVIPLFKYLHKIRTDSVTSKVKAVKNIVQDANFKAALFKTEKLYEQKVEHPKLVELQRIVEKEVTADPTMKMIIFNQYRDNALDVKDKINGIQGAKAELFVGQVKKGETGLSQKEQKEVIEKFKQNEFNVLVATSVGEEGIDVPKVDLVIFYEPIPSAIRHIQRRGRTGRQEKGKVIILMAENTRDEGYRWSAHHKEKRMYRNLDDLKRKVKLSSHEVSLEPYITPTERTKIIVDHREKTSGALKELVDLNVDISLETIENADYVLSNRCGVEFKTVQDFVDSIIDGRLLRQLQSLKQGFERPLVIIEGEDNIYAVRNVHANSIRGMLATIAVSYGIPLLYTKNPKETAGILFIIAKREQEEKGKDFTLHAEKRSMSLKEWQEYIVAALPGIGATLAKPLLKKFKTVRKLFNAKHEQLEKVEKIGPKRAEEIRKVLDNEYEG